MVRHGTHREIGLAHHALWLAPANPDLPKDREAADRMDDLANRWVLDAILRGSYPETVLRAFGLFFPRRLSRDLAEMKAARDLRRHQLLHAQSLPLLPARSASPGAGIRRPAPGGAPCGKSTLAGLYSTLLRLKEEYGNPPCYITENGFPLVERQGIEILDDQERIDYLPSTWRWSEGPLRRDATAGDTFTGA